MHIISIRFVMHKCLDIGVACAFFVLLKILVSFLAFRSLFIVKLKMKGALYHEKTYFIVITYSLPASHRIM